MTLDRLRRNTGFVSWAETLFKTGEWELLMQALESAHPRHFRFTSGSFSEASAVKQLGRVEGYDEAMANLESMAELIREETIPEPTFEPEIQPKKT